MRDTPTQCYTNLGSLSMFKYLFFTLFIIYSVAYTQDSISAPTQVNEVTTCIPDTGLLNRVNVLEQHITSEQSRMAQCEKNLKSLRGTGFFQLLAGVAGIVITIVDANRTEELTYEVPPVNSYTKATTETMSVKHEWSTIHTILTVLSGGLIISGLITIDF